MEELLPKDNENISLPLTADEFESPGPAAFAADQMVRCEDCLRANPPTRTSCLYCGAALPVKESNATLQRPTLRPLEQWEQGYNNILVRAPAALSEPNLTEAADLLRLATEDLSRILSAAIPLPLARAASLDEAMLVQRRLSAIGIESVIFPDGERPAETRELIKVRAIDLDEGGLYAYQSPDAPSIYLPWSDLVLLVSGRLLVKRIELKEQKAKRAENRIIAASEFATDETVIDFYRHDQTTPYRIAANSFDFSCLGAEKSLLSGENLASLVRLFREKAPHALFDDSFNEVRKTLEPVWPSTQVNESSGWRREWPGKISLGTATELNNETQFLRYSRLRYHLLTQYNSETKDEA